jgi:hypothetical protein
MYRTIAVSLLLCFVLTACETTMPWQKRSSQQPPVELLDENELRDITGSTSESSPATAGLPGAARRRFADVPVPADAREDLEQSFVHESRAIQIGRLVYYSKASVKELAQFYIDNCRAEGWEMTSISQAESKVDLYFSKPGKKLDVSVQRQGVGRSQKLTVLLAPQDQ